VVHVTNINIRRQSSEFSLASYHTGKLFVLMKNQKLESKTRDNMYIEDKLWK